jgi:hypothetical protein
MNNKFKGAIAGIIVFVVLGGLWLLLLVKTHHLWALTNISNFLFLICLTGGGVIGFLGNARSGLIAGIITFIFITLIHIFMLLALKIQIPIPRFILSELGHILAFSTVGFVGALLGQRLKLSWNKRKHHLTRRSS